jgi:three-Cys-motif partner protein
MEGLKDYKGREQAYIKHKLLEAYLKRLFMIVGQFQRSICYVDCFAGPWEENRDDLMDTSIGISMKIMADCREALGRMGDDVRFRALYIEKSRRSHAKLQAFLRGNTPSGIIAESFCGEFFDLRQQILEWCKPDEFAFFFIDPKGWKKVVEVPTLKPLLQRPKSEFLINFMYDFILRTHTQKEFEEDMGAIFGEVPETGGMNSKERELHLLTLYRQHLKAHMPGTGGRPRSAWVPILDPERDRTKYELVYLTRNAKGIQVFMDASGKLDLVQKRVRARTKQERTEEKTGQWNLFGAEATVPESDGRVELEAVKDHWMKNLVPAPQYFSLAELADMLEETGWFESDFQKAFGELLSEGKVENLDMGTKRRSRFVHFDANRNKGERLRKLSI